VESGFSPFGLLFIDFIKELESEAVFFRVRFTFESNWCLGEIDFFVGNVSEFNNKEDSVFSLSPLNDWMTKNMKSRVTAW